MTVEKILERSLLFDFYGELLTEHQKQIYQDVVFGDYSLSEVAEAHGISRQGVHDLIRRCDRALKEYEEKLGLVQRFEKNGNLLKEIHRLARTFEETGDRDCVRRIAELSQEMGEL